MSGPSGAKGVRLSGFRVVDHLPFEVRTQCVRISNGVCHLVAGLLDVRLGGHSGSGRSGFRILTVLNNGRVEFKNLIL